MTIRKIDIYTYIAFCITIILGISVQYSYIPTILAVLTYLYVGYCVNKYSSVHMMFFLGFSTFLFLPAILNWYYLDISFNLFFLSSFIAVFFLFLTKETKCKTFIDYGRMPKIIFFLTCLLSIVLLFFGYGRFIAPLMAFIILLMSLCFQQKQFKQNIFYLLMFTAVFMAYLFFYWNGFGRTVIFGWLLLASLQFAYSIDFKVNKYIFGLLPGIGSTLIADRDILQLKFSGFEQALYDSAYAPYRLASTFVEYSNQNGIDVEGFWDQIIFTFFVFIPRSIWPDKPYGFGFEYTMQNLDAYLIDAGHSIAATLVGEHLYYLGYFGLITSLIVFLFIAFATNALYRIKGLNGNGVLIFSASMMVLAWGGMSSFSARIALPSIVFVLLFFLLRKLLTGKIKIVWGS